MKLEDTTARDKFLHKLHRGLISLQLPLKYACLLCLAALWSANKDDEPLSDRDVYCMADAVSMLESNVVKRRKLLSILPPSSLTGNICLFCDKF